MASIGTTVRKEAEVVLESYLAPKMAKQAAKDLAEKLAPQLEQSAGDDVEKLRERILKALGVEAPAAEKASAKRRRPRKKAAAAAAPSEESDEQDDEDEDEDDAPPQRSADARAKMSLKRKVYHACNRLDSGRATDKDKKFLAANPDEVKLFRESQAAKAATAQEEEVVARPPAHVEAAAAAAVSPLLPL